MPSDPGFIQANTLGRLHDAREASISPLDRGFLYGDAIYEVWRTYGGVLFATREHWERLQASAAGLGMGLPLDVDRLVAEARRTIAASRKVTGWQGDHYLRLQITRGGGPIGLNTALAGNEGFWIILVKPQPDLTEAELDNGMTAALAPSIRRNDIRTVPPAFKTGNYLNNILALRETAASGADEVLMVNLEGNLTEGSVRNFWFVKGNNVYTPPLSDGLLAGVTRRILFEHVGPAAGFALSERTLRPDDIGEFSECFVTSTTQDIVSVRSIGQQKYAHGPSTLARRLKKAFRDYAESYRTRHPGFLAG